PTSVFHFSHLFIPVSCVTQHYILAFGGILAIPLILAEPLCIKENHAAKSQLISTIFFVSGMSTLLQTTLGTRLPILQGGTFTFITPTLAILALPKWRCPGTSATPHLNATDSAALLVDGDAIQGAILVASMLQLVLGLSGLVGLVLRFIGPVAIAPTINLIGLSLFIQAGQKSGAHWGIAALTVCLILLFSQYLSKVNLPLIAYKDKKWKFMYVVFNVQALFGMCGAWLVCFLLTYFNALPSSPNEYGYMARTDINLDAVKSAAWFYVPYPGQWGLPTVSVSSVLGMMAGVLASTMESIGDYYACARLSGAPPPPTHSINRGIAVEGVGCILASQNIAALGITRVGSRLVLQTAGLLMIILGLFGKFSSVFITIPDPVIGGMFLVMFGMVAAVGISNLQYVDLNSSRNLLILGFSTFSGLVLPTWFHSNPGMINTGIKELDQLIMILFTTHMFIGGFFGFVLDNTIPEQYARIVRADVCMLMHCVCIVCLRRSKYLSFFYPYTHHPIFVTVHVH
uniref:Si:dkey-106n21.1 n=1 Tax=Sinocyclocheilus rhinocerous TaxID=307959 RepID=A0A673LDF3_9TELE